METARGIMQAARTVAPEATVDEVAELLLNEQLDGVCVVDASGALVGVVTAMDLVFQEKQPRLPAMLYILDAVIPLGSMARSKQEVRRITAVAVRELMTTSVITVGPDARLDEVATRMVEQHLTILPVLEAGKLVGMITKPGVLRAAHALAPK